MKIFVHIPKTAGCSIIKNLQFLGINKVIHHNPKYLDDKVTLDIAELNILNKHTKNIDSYIFTFVRNPYDRLISAYNYLYLDGYLNQLDKTYGKIIRGYPTFDNFVNDLPKLIQLIVHLVPQYLFVCDQNDNICVDFVGKYENLNMDILKIMSEPTQTIDTKNF